MEFRSLDELYERVLPALRIRSSELGMSEKEIFTYLTEEIWKNSRDLTLSKVVDDILNYKIINKDEINWSVLDE